MLGHSWTFRYRFVWQASGIVNPVKTSKMCSISKNNGRLGTFEEGLTRCISPGQGTCPSEKLGGQGTDFGRGLQFPASDRQVFCRGDSAWEARRFVWAGFTVSWQAQCFRQAEWKTQKASAQGRQLWTQLSYFFGRLAGLLRFFLMLSSWRLEEVSQKCFPLDVVQLNKWGSLAELLHFLCCSIQKLRKSRRIVSLSSLQMNGEPGRRMDRQIERWTNTWANGWTGRSVDRQTEGIDKRGERKKARK